MSRARIAFVVRRSGKEVNGGAEDLARIVAERLTRHFDAEVITTCALDYVTWADYYKPGTHEVNGVRVNRFQEDEPREMERFARWSGRIVWRDHTAQEEETWMRLQGPFSRPCSDSWKRNTSITNSLCS